MTNYEMIVNKGCDNPDRFAKRARMLHDKYCSILGKWGVESEQDIVKWLQQRASTALDEAYDIGNLLQDDKGNYLISKAYIDYEVDGVPYIPTIEALNHLGQSSRIDVMHLRKADMPQQILDLVKSQLLEKIKEQCPIVKEVSSAKERRRSNGMV